MACTTCGQDHVTVHGHPSCTSHVTRERADATGYRAPLPAPRPCRRPPGPGLEVCSKHGGAASQTKNAGERRVNEQNARRQLAAALSAAYGNDVPDVPPAEAMLRAVSWTYAEVTVLRAKVAELGEDERVWGRTREKTGGDDRGTTHEAGPNVWWSMLRESMRDLVKFAAAARAAGCDEARVRVAEQTGKLLADVIRGILGDLQLTPEQEAMVHDVVPRHLRSVAS